MEYGEGERSAGGMKMQEQLIWKQKVTLPSRIRRRKEGGGKTEKEKLWVDGEKNRSFRKKAMTMTEEEEEMEDEKTMRERKEKNF